MCGFTFTTNGFINLYKLLKRAFNAKFKQLEQFLNKLGYKNTKSKLYPDLRHEILNEEEYEQIYKDILDFFINSKENK